MGAAILLTGRPGCGKTTAIQRVVAQLARPAGGFITREIRAGGVRQGFEIVTLDGQSGILAHISIKSKQRVGKYGVDLAALESLGVASIRAAVEQGALVVIDEIGPMELYSVAFKAAVLAVLDSPAQLLGTVVQRPNPFTDHLKARPDVRLLTVTVENRDSIPAHVMTLLAADNKKERG